MKVIYTIEFLSFILVPLPRELNVEKKLSRSAVFCWLQPDDQLVPVSQYHVCVDGAVKAVVPGSYKCKVITFYKLWYPLWSIDQIDHH